MIALLSEILCAIFVVVISVMELRIICKERQMYSKSVWNCLQIITLILFFIAVVLYTMRCMCTVWVVDDMMNNPGYIHL